MAEFSKQYIESHMPDWGWDFDINEEFDTLAPGEFKSLICEGYGFRGIIKQLDGSKWFLFIDSEYKTTEVAYDNIVKSTL